jgi:hypothetical protein
VSKQLNISYCIIFSILLLSGLGGIFLCNVAAGTTAKTAKTAAQATNVTYSPTEINDVLYNPYMGWAPWANSTSHSQPFTMVYAPLLWKDLEPMAKGGYDWDGFENRNKFAYWSSRGVKIIIRFYMDDTTNTAHRDIPDWLYKAMGSDKGTAYSTPAGKGFSPNYSDPTLISEHKRVIAALGARYAADSRIAFVEMGSLGHWGEWHCWPYVSSDGGPSGAFPPLAVSDQYVQHYTSVFSGDKLMMRRSCQKAKDGSCGLFNDMFGEKKSLDSAGWGWLWGINNGYTDDRGQKQPAMPEFWKKASSGGEFANGNAQRYLTNSTIKETIREAQTSHTSWLGPCSPTDLASGCPEQANLDVLMKTMGYRFVLLSVTHIDSIAAGSSLSVAMNWNNKGVAPFYFKWPLELSLANASGAIAATTKTNADIRNWLPGQISDTQLLNVPSDLAAGTYTLCVAILDPATNKPGVNLAINGKRPDGRYKLGTVKVTKG